ncbi:ribonuclease Z [Crocinitomix catalasitica]|uniref:ribonuclease Z n=1 Tax=Crocinitomix catalasitica TaxID=184607 RepID=UPI0004815D99|nr:ribonuclease Z [Crocinitomix catalasitica]
MPLKLTILGSGSAVPNLNRGVSAQYLNFNERRILIDCGEGTQLQLRKFKIKFQRLQYIFISHLHGDHFLGIFGLISSMNLLGRDNKLTIFAPVGLEEIIRHQFKLTEVYLGFELEFITVDPTEKTKIFEDDKLNIYAFPLQHRIPCNGFLFEEKAKEHKIRKSAISKYNLSLVEILALKKGQNVMRDEITIKNEDCTLPPEKSLQFAYCSDTKYLPRLTDWIEGADLLYHEATFLTAHKSRAKATGHSTAAQAATIAKDAKVGKLLLGHFSARYKDTVELLAEAIGVFDNVVCVEDGQAFKL